MKSKLFIGIAAILCLIGCHSSFTEFGAGYTRFESDDIRSTVIINGQQVETNLQHVDAFLMKARAGGNLAEAVPQLRAGLEFRSAIGGARDSESVGEQTAYSEIILLLFGGGPFISWKQTIGDTMFIEGGTFIGGYTVGVHEKGRSNDFGRFQVDSNGGVGWSGGLFAKIGLEDFSEFPTRFAFEFAYEQGEWDFGGNIDAVDIENYSFLFSAEIEF